jgi:hypothetical protein
LNELLTAFQSHESIPGGHSGPQYTLDQIREYIRCCLARISPNFTFGEYASVHSLLDYFLTSDAHVTFSERFCPSGHIIDKRELYRSSCCFVLSRAGCGVQEYMDDMSDPLSEVCPSPTCDVSLWRRFTLMYHPPLVSVELGQDASPIDVLELTSQNVCRKYHLRGVIYFAANHFTARLITTSGMVWYHDGIFTGRSLIYESAKAGNIPDENAIVGIYLRSPE